jgi:hypothetical protein
MTPHQLEWFWVGVMVGCVIVLGIVVMVWG